MKNEYTLFFLIASLLIAINTNWALPSKILVVISSITLFLNAVKELTGNESEKNTN